LPLERGEGYGEGASNAPISDANDLGITLFGDRLKEISVRSPTIDKSIGQEHRYGQAY
jgi:hypothetical protein